uniref:Uncharacterized protein n=1 Tax=Anopheles atroparvus TaxID=41427 RepID=A0A182JK98_ANOAO
MCSTGDADANDATQPQYEYIQQPSGPDGGNGGIREQQQPGAGVQYQPAGMAGQRAQAAPYAQAPANGEADSKLIGVAFSPSNEVSQVKFSSNGLKYNF